jgi:hypothetical protein
MFMIKSSLVIGPVNSKQKSNISEIISVSETVDFYSELTLV